MITNNALKTRSYTANQYRCPSAEAWKNNTSVYVFSANAIIDAQRSTISEVVLSDTASSATDKNFCEANLISSAVDDEDLLIYTLKSGSNVKTVGYFVRTYTSSENFYAGNNAGLALSYLKCKYFVFTIKVYFYWSDTSITLYNNNFTNGYCNSYTSYGGLNTKYFSQSYQKNDGTDVDFVHEVDIYSIVNAMTSNFNFRAGDAMVLRWTFS